MSALPIFPIAHTGEKYTKKNMIASPPRKKNYKASPRKEEIQKWVYERNQYISTDRLLHSNLVYPI